MAAVSIRACIRSRSSAPASCPARGDAANRVDAAAAAVKTASCRRRTDLSCYKRVRRGDLFSPPTANTLRPRRGSRNCWWNAVTLRSPKPFRRLKQGEIQVLDRRQSLASAVAPRRQASAGSALRLPLVHCLIPNVRRPLLADPTFRRALAYENHRQAILNQMLGGVEIPGCVVASGPFPVGVGADDPISYATDEKSSPGRTSRG